MRDTANQDWRLEAQLRERRPATSSWSSSDPDAGPPPGSLEEKVVHALGDGAVVSADDDSVFVYASSAALIDAVRPAVEQVVRAHGILAVYRVEHWDGSLWTLTEGPSRPPLPRRVTRVDPPARRSAWRLGALAVFLAGIGIALYAADPGVASNTVSWLLVFPAAVCAVGVLGRAVPRRWQWPLAVLFAPTGGIAYTIAGGAQWWRWGPYTAFPLIGLIVMQGIRAGGDTRSEPWLGGVSDGPWGPP